MTPPKRDRMKLYKVTAEDGRAYHGGSGRWQQGRWRSVRGELVACERGLHLCRRQDLVGWLGPVVWEAEADGSELIEQSDKVVARRARVVRRIETWNERTARLFAADCAERVLPIFEKQAPVDPRPREAIAVARRFANGEATREELAAARAAAWDAAWGAAWAAARDAARAAARAAAWDAAWGAAWAAARDAARGDFMSWATDRLFDYLEGRTA